MQCQMYPRFRNAQSPIRYNPRGRIVQPTRLMSQPPPKQSTAGVAHTLAQAQADLEEDPSKDNFDRVANMAREAYDIGKSIMGMINIEYKRLQSPQLAFQPVSADATCTQSGVQNNNHINPLYDIVQGTEDDMRTGDSIKVQDFVMRGTWSATNATSVIPYIGRIVIYWDESNQISTTFAGGASVSGLLDPIGSSTALAPHATKDYDGDAKTKILYDRKFYIGQYGQDKAKVTFDLRLKIGRHCNFENNSGAINSGALKIIVLQDITSADVNRASFTGFYQVYYTDD